MNYFNPVNLGIIACPGGVHFADKVTHRLVSLYHHRFERKVQSMAASYKVSTDDVIKQMSFLNDAQSPFLHKRDEPTHYKVPDLRVKTRHSLFSNGEMKTELLSSVRGKDIYIFQDVENKQPCKFNDNRDEKLLSVNDHVFNLLVTVDAAIQADAGRITVVMPAYPYARQHKKKGREGLTAARLGQMFEYYGISRIITLDIHSREIENCFNKLRLENLHASYQIIEKLANIIDVSDDNLVVVSPDTGAVDRNKFYASTLQKSLALLYKERDYSKVSKNANESNISAIKLLGDIRGKTVFIADDMLGTGGTLLKAMRYLKDQGAEKIICAVSLALFSATAIEDFDKAYKEGYFYRIIGTNAVHHSQLLSKEWYIEADVSMLFAQIISLLHQNRSLSSLLDNRDIIAKKIKKAMGAQKAVQPSLFDNANIQTP